MNQDKRSSSCQKDTLKQKTRICTDKERIFFYGFILVYCFTKRLKSSTFTGRVHNDENASTYLEWLANLIVTKVSFAVLL